MNIIVDLFSISQCVIFQLFIPNDWGIKFVQNFSSCLNFQFFSQWQDIVEGGSTSTIKSVLSEMKGMLNTPIKAFSAEDSSQLPSSPPPSPVSEDGYSIPEGDVPGQFTRVMWKGNSHIHRTQRLNM